MSRIHNRRAFTLVELMAALMLTGFVIAGGIALLDQLSDSHLRIDRARIATSRGGNGTRILRASLLDAHSTADSLDRFRGEEHSAQFATNCQWPNGWLEPCRATLIVDGRTDSSAIVAQLSSGEQIDVLRVAGNAELRYFDASTPDSAWLRRWAPSVTLPLAVAVLTATDTIVYPLGTSRE